VNTMAIVRSRANDLAIAKIEREWSEQRERIKKLEDGIRRARALADHFIHGESALASMEDVHKALTETLAK
jgi:hypothetical protein